MGAEVQDHKRGAPRLPLVGLFACTTMARQHQTRQCGYLTDLRSFKSKAVLCLVPKCTSWWQSGLLRAGAILENC